MFTYLLWPFQPRRRGRRSSGGWRRRGRHGDGDLLRRVEERQADRLRAEPALGRAAVRRRVAEQQAPRLRLHHLPRRHQGGGQVQAEHPGERQEEELDPPPGQQDPGEGGPSGGGGAEGLRHRTAEGWDRSVQVRTCGLVNLLSIWRVCYRYTARRYCKLLIAVMYLKQGSLTSLNPRAIVNSHNKRMSHNDFTRLETK